MRARLSLVRTHVGALIALGCALFGLALLSGFITDDAAITLRYAAELASGHGLCWNPGEHPVEGYSNFSQVLLGAGFLKLGLPALSALRAWNQLGMLGVCVLTYALALRVLSSRLFATVAAVFVGAHPALAYWASSGLETGVYLCAVYAGLLASTRLRSPRDLRPAFWLLVAALTRLEGLVVFGCVLASLGLQALFARDGSRLRVHARWLAMFVILYAGYFAFRVSYFGHLLSNSAYFKLRDPSGFLLIAQFVAQNGALLALALLAPFRRLGRFGVVIALLALVYGVGFYGVKDSVADFHRFFLPLVPGIAILAAATLARIDASARLGRGRHALTALGFVIALGYDVAHPVSGFANLRREVALLDTRIVSRGEVARTLAERLPATARLAVDDVGVIGYVLQNPIADLFGLNNEAFIHSFHRDRTPYVHALLAARPAAVVVVSRDRNRFVPEYATGWLVTTSTLFRREYEELAVIASPAEEYHYFVFARRELGPLPPRRALELERNRSLAGAIDALYQRVRRPP